MAESKCMMCYDDRNYTVYLFIDCLITFFVTVLFAIASRVDVRQCQILSQVRLVFATIALFLKTHLTDFCSFIYIIYIPFAL